MPKHLLFPALPPVVLFRAPDDPAPAGGDPAPAGGDPAPVTDPAPAGDPAPAADPAPAKKWFETDHFTDDERRTLAAKGLTGIEDPTEAAAKIAKLYRAAETRIGKGLDSIMDRPAKGQAYAEWAKANAEALGLPADEAGYAVDRPESWPKDMPWDETLETAAKKMAADMGVPPDVHKAYVGIFAERMANMAQELDAQAEASRAALMADLQKDWGKTTQAQLTMARQAMEFAATEAGLPAETVSAALQTLTEKTGDPAVMKMFATIGRLMGEDRAVSLNNGSSLSMTPAEANAQMAALSSPGGELFEALKAQREGVPGAAARLTAAQAKRTQLAKVAAGG